MTEKKQTPEQQQGKTPPAPAPFRGFLLWAVILTFILMGIQYYVTAKKQAAIKEIKYNPEFVAMVTNGLIAKCEVVREVSGISYIRGDLKAASTNIAPAKFKVYITDADGGLRDFLVKNGVEFSVPPQNPMLWQILSSVLPGLLIFGFLYFLFMRQMRSAGAGAMSFGKSRARMLNRDKNKITFNNVAGIDESKEEVQEIIEFLKDPKKFQTLGGRIPKGVLLVGPPGTGKTLLAKAIAGEANVPFFSISGSDFVEMFVGVGASRVRDMFEQGKRSAPCIIFIDEIDAVGRSRFSGIGGGHDEREQTLNALLVEMDGFETQQGVIIIAATNRPDVLDPALLRPGRFDRQVVIDLPSLEGRHAILKIHATKIKLGPDADLAVIARGTPGFSGADLENLLNEAALLGAREDKPAVTMKDLEEARDKVRWGRERRSRVLDEKEKKVTAYHEAGHALMMIKTAGSEPLHKLTIIPRGSAYLGATMQLPQKDRYIQGRKELQAMLVGLMGGRVAEETFFDDITSGAGMDLKEATRIARLMVCSWGMSEALGPQSFGDQQELLFLGREVSRSQNYSEDTSRRIDAEVHRLLDEAHKTATATAATHRDVLKLIAETLIERETLDRVDVEELIEFGRIRTTEERPAVALPENPQPAATPPPLPE